MPFGSAPHFGFWSRIFDRYSAWGPTCHLWLLKDNWGSSCSGAAFAGPGTASCQKTYFKWRSSSPPSLQRWMMTWCQIYKDLLTKGSLCHLGSLTDLQGANWERNEVLSLLCGLTECSLLSCLLCVLIYATACILLKSEPLFVHLFVYLILHHLNINKIHKKKWLQLQYEQQCISFKLVL